MEEGAHIGHVRRRQHNHRHVARLQVLADPAAVRVLQHEHRPDEIGTGKTFSAARVLAMTRAALLAEHASPALDRGRIERAEPFDAAVDSAAPGRRLRAE